MKIFDLITSEVDRDLLSIDPSLDPLYEDNVLVEATLLDILHYTLFSTTGLLIDLRTSMYFDAEKANTGIIICRDVNKITLEDNLRSFRTPYVWMIGDSRLRVTGDAFELLLPLVNSKIQIHAKKLHFYIGMVPHIGEISTSLDDGIEGYLQTTPHWESDFEIFASSFRN